VFTRAKVCCRSLKTRRSSDRPANHSNTTTARISRRCVRISGNFTCPAARSNCRSGTRTKPVQTLTDQYFTTCETIAWKQQCGRRQSRSRAANAGRRRVRLTGRGRIHGLRKGSAYTNDRTVSEEEAAEFRTS
jgi:hypothetical protein